jgi:hypothetical protein
VIGNAGPRSSIAAIIKRYWVRGRRLSLMSADVGAITEEFELFRRIDEMMKKRNIFLGKSLHASFRLP